VVGLIKELESYQDFLESGEERYDRGIVPYSPGAAPPTFSRKDILQKGKDKLKELSDQVYKWQDAYDQVRSTLDDG
jgi:hypothetical protein